MSTNPKISHEQLKEFLSYDPETGVFRRLKAKGRARAGDVVGYLEPNGYWRIYLGGEMISAHRLAWFYVYGQWPLNQIDHINRNRSDNRIANLRDVTRAVNLKNRPVYGAVPFLGVTLTRSGRRFASQITINRKTRYLGSFKTAEEAHQAYLSAQNWGN